MSLTNLFETDAGAFKLADDKVAGISALAKRAKMLEKEIVEMEETLNERNEQYTGDFFPSDFPARWDWTERAREIVTAHRAEVDLLVCISHLGNGGDEALAAAVDGIDVILGAHSHTVLMREEVVNNTIIIQCGSSLGWVGRLDLDFDLFV